MVVYNHVPDFPSIETGLDFVDYAVLLDNSTDQTVTRTLERFAAEHPGRCILAPMVGNQGLSKAYNIGTRLVEKLGVDWVYLLDHDAVFRAEYFVRTREGWAELSRLGLRIGALVPIVSDDPQLLDGAAGIRRKWSILTSAITSGILTRVCILNEVGGFDETMFVEAADFELTSRMRRLGWEICCVNQVLIIQEFEDPVVGSTLPIVLGTAATKARSLIRVAIGNANILRTRLSSYNPRRAIELRTTLRNLNRVRGLRRQISIIRALNRVESTYVGLFCQPHSRSFEKNQSPG